MRRSTAALALAAVMFLLAGCLVTEYNVEMDPQGPQMQRTLTISVHDGATTQPQTAPAETQPAATPSAPPVGEETLRQLQAVYGADNVGTDDKGRAVARGKFGPNLPGDLGAGTGRYFYFESSLGKAWAYAERLRGNDDQLAVLQEQLAAVDALADIAAGYVKHRFGDSADSNKLQDFIRTTLAKDAKNLSLQLRTAVNGSVSQAPTTAPSKDVALMEIPARAFMYLAERDYIPQADIEKLARAIMDSSLGDNERFGLAEPILRQMIQKKVDLSPKFIDQVLAAVRDPNLAEAVNSYIEKTAAFTKWAVANKDPNDPNATLTARDYTRELMDQAVALDLLDGWGADKASFAIKCTTQPFFTNGAYDANLPGIRWSFDLNQSKRKPPIILYAVAATPDEKFQTAHFGRTLLDGEKLMQYCMWHKALTAAEAKQWHDLLVTIKPTDSMDRVRDFRFAGRPATEPTTRPDTAGTLGAQLLLNAIPQDPNAVPPDPNQPE